MNSVRCDMLKMILFLHKLACISSKTYLIRVSLLLASQKTPLLFSPTLSYILPALKRPVTPPNLTAF